MFLINRKVFIIRRITIKCSDLYLLEMQNNNFGECVNHINFMIYYVTHSNPRNSTFVE